MHGNFLTPLGKYSLNELISLHMMPSIFSTAFFKGPSCILERRKDKKDRKTDINGHWSSWVQYEYNCSEDNTKALFGNSQN